MLWLLLLPLASLLRPATSTTGGSNTSCTEQSCGNLTIRYPFSLAGAQPLYCGYPSFDLTCDGASPGPKQAYLSNTFRDRLLRVTGISYKNNSTVTVVLQTTFVGDGGCPVPDFNVSSSLALFPFNISAANNRLVFFYGCAVPVKLQLPRPCGGNRTIGAYFSGLWGQGGDTLPPGNLPSNCTSVSVPVRGAPEPARLHYERLIADGFLLELPAPLGDCDACRRMSGECRFDALSFQCVCPDWNLCPNLVQSNSTTHQDRGKLRLKICAGIATALLCLVVLSTICIIHNVRSKRKRSALLGGRIIREGSPLASPKKDFTLAGSQLTHIFTYEELDEATDGFNDARVVGAGGFGTVYKGILRDGSVVAVKRLYKNSYKGMEQFANEVDILSRLRHPNLVAFYGCTSSSQGSCCRDLLLAYEFVSNGTLAYHLQSDGEAPLLAWPTRLGIAVEAAGALVYLHAGQVVHRDVKTSNILLDEEFHVKVADFGLCRLFSPDATHVSTAPQGTPGYVDPAYHHRYQLTDKSDVYSFGVVLAELISSRPAVDMSRAGTDVNLASMAMRMIQCCEINKLVDPRLGYGSASETMKTVDLVAEVAFRCLQLEQDVRPSISEVLDVLREAHQSMMEKGNCAARDDDVLLKKSSDGSPDSVMHQWISPSTTTNHST